MKKYLVVLIITICFGLITVGCEKATSPDTTTERLTATDEIITTQELTVESEDSSLLETDEDDFEIDLDKGTDLEDYPEIFMQSNEVAGELVAISKIAEKEFNLTMNKVIEDEVFFTIGYITDNKVKIDLLFGKDDQKLFKVIVEGTKDRNTDFSYLISDILFVEALDLSDDDREIIVDDYINNVANTDIDACLIFNMYYTDPEVYELTIKN